MPLDASRLANSMKSQIESIEGAPALDGPELLKFCQAISNAVVQEFVANAQTNPGQHVTVNTSTGIGATDQPGTIS